MAIPIGQIKIYGEARFVVAPCGQDLETVPVFDFAKLKMIGLRALVRRCRDSIPGGAAPPARIRFH